jgi:hypothetical protein
MNLSLIYQKSNGIAHLKNWNLFVTMHEIMHAYIVEEPLKYKEITLRAQINSLHIWFPTLPWPTN